MSCLCVANCLFAPVAAAVHICFVCRFRCSPTKSTILNRLVKVPYDLVTWILNYSKVLIYRPKIEVKQVRLLPLISPGVLLDLGFPLGKSFPPRWWC